jgi:hypothetical protein
MTKQAMTQGWTREAAIHVASTAVVADTDLRGTLTTGYDKVVVHNKDGSNWVGCQPVPAAQQASYTAATFAAMTVFVPPNATVEIEDENIIRLRHICDTGETADLIIERHERR